MRYAYVNGKILPDHKAVISIFDRGIVLGDGLFETLRAVEFVPEFFNAHYSRLKRSARILRIKVPLSRQELGRIVHTLCSKSRVGDAVVRITLTRGPYTGGLSIDKKVTPSLFVTAGPVTGLPHSIYTKGVKVAVSTVSKTAAAGATHAVKTTNYLANILARSEADSKNCFEALLLGEKGEIAEFSTASFFCVVNQRIVTPPVSLGILPGITRQEIMKILAKNELPCHEKVLFLKDIPRMTEAFLTSSVRGIVPVIKIQGRTIGKEQVGPFCKELQRLYQEERKKSRMRFQSA
ncbi:aminotransferase class IV [Fibrobacterota bacterium]